MFIVMFILCKNWKYNVWFAVKCSLDYYVLHIKQPRNCWHLRHECVSEMRLSCVSFSLSKRCLFSCFFILHRVYSNSRKMSKVGEFPWSLIFWRPHLSLERERKVRRRLLTSSVKYEVRHFHVVIVQWRQRNVQESVMHVQSCCFANLKLPFLTFSLPSPSSLLLKSH